MSHKDQLRDPLFRNWVRGALALKYLKQGLVVHIDQSVKTQHALFIASLTSGATGISCGVCTLDNLLPEHAGGKCIQKTKSRCLCSTKTGRRKCPLSYCSSFADLVVNDHCLKDPIWINSDPTRWLSQYWELAKCFLSTPGKNDANSAKDADAADLLTIAINNASIRNNIQTIDNFIKARNVRNDILHSASHEVQDTELADYIRIFIEVLLDGALIHQHTAQNAIKDLNQLKNDQIVISLEDVDEIRANALKTIDEKKEMAIQVMNDKEVSLNEIYEKADKKCHNLCQALTDEKCQMLQDVEAAKLKAVHCIEEHEKDSMDCLTDKKNSIQHMTEKSIFDSTIVICNRFEEMKRQFLLDIQQGTKHLTEVVLHDYDKYGFSKLEDMKAKSELLLSNLYNDKEKLLQVIKMKHIEELDTETKRIKDKVCKEIDMYLHKNATILEGPVNILKNNPEPGEGNQDVTNQRLDRTPVTSIEISTDLSKYVIVVPPSNEEIQYSKIKQEFQNDLVSFYKRHNDTSTISMSPLSRTYDAPLLQVFVLPNMTFKHNEGLQQNFSCPVNSYKDILFHASRRVRNVYISGPAGAGKSVLARHMCLAWCHAREPQTVEDPNFSKDDVTALQDFDFLFLVDLGNATHDCEMHEIISKQVVNELPQANIYSKTFLSRILSKEKCIIVNDSLDRWSHPNPDSKNCQRHKGILPHINCGDNVTIVSMTRHWKLHTHDLNFKQMDMNVEFVNDSRTAFEALTKRTISHLNSLSESNKNETDFLDLVKSMNFEMPSFTRLGHIHFICQWFENRITRKSRTELYGYLTDVLFVKYNSVLKAECLCSEETSDMTERKDNSHKSMDRSLKRYKEPKQLNSQSVAILKIGKLSLDSMMSSKSEVTEIVCAKHFLSRDEIQFAIDLGILNVKMTRRLTSANVSLSFEDPRFQAYFAARYVVTIDPNTVMKQMISFSWRKLKKNTVSDFLVFLAGLNPSLIREISKNMYKIDDESMSQYRNGSDAFSVYEKRLRYLQDCFLDCVREMLTHNRDSPPVVPHIEDIFVDEACKDADYCSMLNLLISCNKDHIKSVTIYHNNISQNILQSVEMLSVSSPQRLAVLSKSHSRVPSVKTDLNNCSNALLDIIHAFFSKASSDLKSVSIGGIGLSPQIFDTILNTRRVPALSMHKVCVLETANCNSGKYGCKISFKIGSQHPYLFLCGNAAGDIINKALINQLSYLKTVKLQNISVTSHQLDIIGKMSNLYILYMWHVRLSDTTRNSEADSVMNIKNSFDIKFNREKSSIEVRGQIPNVFMKTFFENNSRALKHVKVICIYLTLQSLYNLCSTNQEASVVLKGITVISKENECRMARYVKMQNTFKCEYQSPTKKLTLCGFAPESVYKGLIQIYAETLMQIELRDVSLSEQDLNIIAGMKHIDLLTMVNITRTLAGEGNGAAFLNTFDMIYAKNKQKIYVCGDISSLFFHSVIDSHSLELKVADLRYLTETTACLNALEIMTDIQELSLFFCRSDFDDTATVVRVLNAVSGSLQFAQIGCHLLLSKHCTECHNKQQSGENMSIREVIHSSKAIDLKRDQDVASLKETFCLRWEHMSMSLCIEGKTPEEYIHHFLQKHNSFTSLCLKGIFLSMSDIEELQNAGSVTVLRLTDITYEETEDKDENLYNKEDSEKREDCDKIDYAVDDVNDDDNDGGKIAYDNDGEKDGDIENNNEKHNSKVSNLICHKFVHEKELSVEELDGNVKNINKTNNPEEEEHHCESRAIDVGKIEERFSEKKFLSCDIVFDHFQDKLFVSGEITNHGLFKVLSKFCKTSKAIRLQNVKLRHIRRKEIFSIIDMNTDIKAIEIDNIKCADHEVCTAVSMNLSAHYCLQMFELKSVGITDITINAKQLQSCKFGWLMHQGVATSILRSLEPVTETLELINIGGVDVDIMTQVIPTLIGLKSLEICWVNINDRDLQLFPFLERLERLVLWHVKMSFEAFKNFIKDARYLKETVRIRFNKCELIEEKCDVSIDELKDFINQQSRYKPEEELIFDNGQFSGIYLM